jgi:hypothetical protein
MAAVGALAVCSAALATFGSDTRLLRLGVSCSLAAAVSTAALLRAREREQARELSVESSGRRLEQAEFQQQIKGLGGVVDKLNAEIVTLREELAEVTAAHAAALLVKTAPARPTSLTREAFAEAAAALAAGPERSGASKPVERLATELRPIELALAAAVVKPAPKAEPEEPVAAEAEEAQVAEADEPTVVQAEEPATADDEPKDQPPEQPEDEPGDQVGDEAEPAQVIDLTAHDDTQPLRLAGVRKRA